MVIGIDVRLWSQTGVGRYIRNLVLNLQKIDKTNDYVLFARKEDFEAIQNLGFIIQESKWKIVETDIKWHSVSEQIRFASILEKAKLDIVHFPYFSVPIFYNRPFVVTIHDLIINHFPTGKASTLAFPIYKMKLFAYRVIIKKAAQKAKKIITVSNATKEEILDHLRVDKDKVVVVYNGVDEGISNEEQNTKYKLQNTKYFLYVGNAYPHKNLERLLLAFSELLKENKNVKLVLVGREDYFYNKLKDKLKNMNLKNSIIFYQEINDKELVNLYKNALALVMPSLMEGFGLPVAEAMTNGCPVLASEIPSLKEIAKEAAAYFNPQNVEDMAKALGLMINDEGLRSEMIKKGYERVKIFSWEKSAKETLKVYESCFSL